MKAAVPTATEPVLSPAVAQALRPGQSVALLQQLHILTREGHLNQDSRRKLKQVYHLFQFIENCCSKSTPTPTPPLAPRA